MGEWCIVGQPLPECGYKVACIPLVAQPSPHSTHSIQGKGRPFPPRISSFPQPSQPAKSSWPFWTTSLDTYARRRRTPPSFGWTSTSVSANTICHPFLPDPLDLARRAPFRRPLSVPSSSRPHPPFSTASNPRLPNLIVQQQHLEGRFCYTVASRLLAHEAGSWQQEPDTRCVTT